MAQYQNILVGIDGSKQSLAAFDKAVLIAKANHATLHLVSVVNGERYPTADTIGYGFMSREVYEGAVNKMEAVLADYKQRALDDGVEQVKTKVVIGNVKQELTTGYAEDEPVDLLVIGATGLNALGKMLVGSTTTYVVARAPYDVEVVKTDLDNAPLDIERTSYPKL